jgi:hypothetical protein
MKHQTILWVLIGLVLLILFAPPTVEFFRSKSPEYCNGDNSCLSQGCSLDPSNQPCDRSRTIQQSISNSDSDWGTLLGGQSIEVCSDRNGVMIDSNTCGQCSVCGVVVPPSGNLSGGLCVPLSPKGCMKNAPSGKFLEFLNNTPEAISC